jgi:DNA-binding transcriptional LysR family regulator
MSTSHVAPSLEQLDLNLLLTFDVVYRERNLTRAARRLFVSQSAVSHALARLRGQLGDPLFVRRAPGVVPTPFAERLAPGIDEALRLLRRALERQDFDPAHDLRRVALAMHDELEPVILPPLVARLRAAAPAVEIECVRLERGTVERDLGSGRLDLVIDVAQATGPELRHAPLASDVLCVVSRRRRALDARRYLAAGHVTVSSRRSGPSLEDMLLARGGHQRSVVVRCRRYEAACRIVAESDLLLTAPRLHAQSIAARMGLVVRPLPFDLPPVARHLYWHRQVDTDPRSQWLRGEVLSGALRRTLS